MEPQANKIQQLVNEKMKIIHAHRKDFVNHSM